MFFMILYISYDSYAMKSLLENPDYNRLTYVASKKFCVKLSKINADLEYTVYYTVYYTVTYYV